MFLFQQQMPRHLTLQNVFCWWNVKDFPQSKMSQKASILYSDSLIGMAIETIQQLTAATAADAVWGSPSTSSAVHRGFAFQEETNNSGCRAKICLSLSRHQLPSSARGHYLLLYKSPLTDAALLEVKATVGLPQHACLLPLWSNKNLLCQVSKLPFWLKAVL